METVFFSPPPSLQIMSPHTPSEDTHICMYTLSKLHTYNPKLRKAFHPEMEIELNIPISNP